MTAFRRLGGFALAGFSGFFIDGGLTEALEMIAAAEEEGLIVMVGCIVSSSLAMAPAFVAAQRAQYADIDGPLLLARDRLPGLMFSGSIVHPPYPDLWG